MKRHEQINKLVDEALESMDDAQRAQPRPFLLTRINARMSKTADSVWEKAGSFISRPAVAFAGLCFILLLNVMVVMFNKSSDTNTIAGQNAPAHAEDFTYTIATIYDNDNTP